MQNWMSEQQLLMNESLPTVEEAAQALHVVLREIPDDTRIPLDVIASFRPTLWERFMGWDYGEVALIVLKSIGYTGIILGTIVFLTVFIQLLVGV